MLYFTIKKFLLYHISSYLIKSNLLASLSININDIKNQFSDRDFSIVAGIGLRLPARLGVSLRYVKGLKNVSDPSIINEETKNTMFQLSLKYSLIQLGIKKSKE